MFDYPQGFYLQEDSIINHVSFLLSILNQRNL